MSDRREFQPWPAAPRSANFAGLPYQVNSQLPKGTARLYGPETMEAWLEVDSIETAQRIIDHLNKRESEFRAWLDKDFLQACGIEVVACNTPPS